MRFPFLLPALAIALLAQTPTAFADTIIGTTGPASTAVGPLGTTSSFGESFNSPGGTLSSFTFSSITDIFGTYATFVVAPFTGTTPGTPLYSGTFALTTGSNTFSNLNVATTLGTEYLAYLTVFGVTGDVITGAAFRANGSYAGGAFYFLNGTANPTGTAFDNRLTNDDLLFSATFTPAVNVTPGPPAVAVTPEPSSLLLLATGMMAAGGFVMRRRSGTIA